MRLLLFLIVTALSAQTLQFHAQTGTRPATSQQVADMLARLDANAPRDPTRGSCLMLTTQQATEAHAKTENAPVSATFENCAPAPQQAEARQATPAILKPPALRPPFVTKLTLPICLYIPFYSLTQAWLPGIVEGDTCEASSTSLGTLEGYPNSMFFQASWRAVLSNDAILFPTVDEGLTSHCGPSYGGVSVDWETFYVTYLGAPAFQISSNVYNYNGLSETLVLVGEWTTYWDAPSQSWITIGGQAPAGGITCPAN